MNVEPIFTDDEDDLEDDGPTFSIRQDDSCESEILMATIMGDDLVFGDRTAAENSSLIRQLPPSIWEAFVTTHSFLVPANELWVNRWLPEMQRSYLAGLASWFTDSGG